MSEASKLYGVSAEFATPEAMLDAARRLRERGIGLLDTLSPLPIPVMAPTLGLRGPSLGWVASGGFLLGAAGCFGMMAYATVASYPFMVAGRPPLSWPYFIVPSIAGGTLVSAVLTTLAMFFLDRLPRLNHPVFNIDGIEGVTQDRLFLLVEARSEDFDAAEVEQALIDLPQRPLRIQRVPR